MTLTILIWLPLACALLGALLPEKVSPRIMLLGALGALGLSIAVLVDFHSGRGLQFVVNETWIKSLGVRYKLGIDGLNVMFVLLTTIVFTAGAIAANVKRWQRPKLFYFYLALAESAILGAFVAQDLILFVVFFDLMLIPFYFLVGIWGERNRVAATTKLVIYTLVGSLLMLAAAIATGVIAAQDSGLTLSYAFSDLAQRPLSTGSQEWIFVLFALAFLIKMPAFPVHGWMPDGYRAMPIPVLAVFASVLSKVAAYGFLRIVLPLFPAASVHFQTLMLVLAVASILYGSIMAFTTNQARLVIGFSSVAQLGFITLGIFALNPQGAQGAMMQMLTHGLVVVPAMLVIGALAVRASGSEDISKMGGMAFRAPVLTALFLLVVLANLAMPGSANFIGEFYVLLGVFQSKLAVAIVASVGVVLASIYMLRMFIRTMHNRPSSGVESRELSAVEALAVVPTIAVILALSFYPHFALTRTAAATTVAVSRADRLARGGDLQEPGGPRPPKQVAQR